MSTLVRRKPGPVAQTGRVRVTLYLDETLAEWGKRQDGGLSDLVRQLLAEAQAERQVNAIRDPYPPELRATYKRLIDNKLRDELTPEEETELSFIRAQINRMDRTTEAWRRQERAAAGIDHELADLRREIETALERG